MTRKKETGIALIAVIAALSALLLIAVPFALSMRDHLESATSFSARARARTAAQGILACVKARLYRTHESVDETPKWDTQDEIAPSFDGIPFPVADPKGMMWSARVEDEQGKIHLGSASPYLLGNLLGLAHLSTPIAQTDVAIAVDDPSRFSKGGGLVWIDGELIQFAATDERGLVGCKRGFQVEWARFLDPVEHGEGAIVLDARAVFIAHLGLALGNCGSACTRLRPLPSATAIRRIAELGPVSITAAELDRLLPLVTVHSLRSAGDAFGNAQAIRNTVELVEEDALGGHRAELENARYYNTGTVIELSDGATSALCVVNRAPRGVIGTDTPDEPFLVSIGTDPMQAGVSRVKTEASTALDTDGIENLSAITYVPPQLRSVWLSFLTMPEFAVADGRTLTVTSLPRHPININTASDEVLIAVLENLQIAGSQDRVSRDEAIALVPRLRAKPISGYQDLLERVLQVAVDDGVISEGDLDAIYTNALCANDVRLAFATAPFAFVSSNVFTVEATAIVNNRAGVALDRETVREVVHIGPPEVATWSLNSQESLEEQIIARQDSKYITTYPARVGRYERNNEPPSRFRPHRIERIFPSDEVVDEDGEDEGDLRSRPVRVAREANVEHFDAEPSNDGLVLDGGAYDAPMIRSLECDLGMTAGYVRFWVEFPGGGSGATLFDAGQSADRNRVRLFHDAGDGALKLQVYDAAFADPTLAGSANACEASYPITLEPETWYHITAAWRGTKPGDLTIFVDGINRTRHAYRTRLTQSLGLDTDTASISVEDASDFPPSGALLLSREVLEYTSRTNSSFTLRADPVGGLTRGDPGSPPNDATRHRRGLDAQTHESGTTVELLGYTVPLESDLRIGGASLASDLGMFCAAALVGPPSGPTPPLTQPWIPATVTRLVIGPLPDATDPNAYKDAFQDQGYALIVSTRVSFGSRNYGGIELITYRKTSDTTLEVARGVISPNTTANPYAARDHIIGSPSVPGFLAAVIPISIAASGPLFEGYIDPSTEFAQGTSLVGSERIRIGDEWIRYESIDNEFFLRDDTAAFNDAQSRLDSYNANGVAQAGELSLDFQIALDMRAVDSTEHQDHSSGDDIVPCFRVWQRGPGFDDVVTILGAGGVGEQARVTHSAMGFALVPRGRALARFVSLDRNVQRDYPSTIQPILLNNQNGAVQVSLLDSRQSTRLVKVPSGELPTVVPTTLGFNRSISGGGGVGMVIDEVEINRMREVMYFVNLLNDDDVVRPGDRDVPLARVDALVGYGIGAKSGFRLWPDPNPRFTELPPDGGIVWAGDEIIAYRDVEDNGYDPTSKGQYFLKDCVRGAFNTRPATLRDGERAYLLSFLDVTRLTSGVSATAAELPVADATGFPPSGTLAVVANGSEMQELIHYTDATQAGFFMPERRDPFDSTAATGDGIFRARYGTAALGYGARDLVVSMPFRYWDRSAPLADDPEMAYFELSRVIPGAYFQSVDWKERIPHSLVDVEVLVRIDRRAPWSAEPKGVQNGLFRFDAAASETEIDNIIGMAGDRIELRVSFPYRVGAFDPTGSSNAWKDTAWLKSIDVRYLAPRRVETHEVLP